MNKGFWKKLVRPAGYNFEGSGSSQYNGRESKRDVSVTRTKLKRLLNKLGI